MDAVLQDSMVWNELEKFSSALAKDALDALFGDDFALSDFFGLNLQPSGAADSRIDASTLDCESATLLHCTPTVVERPYEPPVTNDPHERTSARHLAQVSPALEVAEAASCKPKSNQFTDAEWEEIFVVVSTLYLESSLKEILKILPEKTNFKPSRKQLKTKIQLWHTGNRLPRKNIDKDDMDYMVFVAHLRNELQGLHTEFKYYGFPVSLAKLRKHKDRFGIKHQELNHQNPPSYITWGCNIASETTPPAAVGYVTPLYGPLVVQDLVTNMQAQSEPVASMTRSNDKDQVNVNDNGENANSEIDNLDKIETMPSSSPPLNRSEIVDGKLLGYNGRTQGESSDKELARERKKRTFGATHSIPESESSSNVNSPPVFSMRNTTVSPTPIVRGLATENPLQTLLLEPVGESITVEQLVSAAKNIYSGLVPAELKCIQVIGALTSASGNPGQLTSTQWQALIALHRTLLHEHHDFLTATHHPSATEAMKRLPARYLMLARMWKHGCHLFLELLRRHLPDTGEYLRRFLYLAYQIYAALLESLPLYYTTWTEVLGDLSRYWVAIEDDTQVCYAWLETSRSWYQKAAHQSPTQGRLPFYLSILSKYNDVCRLFHLSRSFTSGIMCPLARQEFKLALCERSSSPTADRKAALELKFVRTHAAVYRNDLETARRCASEFKALFAEDSMESAGFNIETSTNRMAIINIACLFDYGNSTPLRYTFQVANFLFSQSKTTEDMELPEALRNPIFTDLSGVDGFLFKCDLMFMTLEIILSQQPRPNNLPHVLMVMTFLDSLSKACNIVSTRFASAIFDARSVLDRVPWQTLCEYMNKHFTLDDVPTSFPQHGDPKYRPLPEDYWLRGLVWTETSFPSGFFDSAPEDEEDRMKEISANNELRKMRILWLAHELCSTGYMTFQNGVFLAQITPHVFQGVDSIASLASWIGHCADDISSIRDIEQSSYTNTVTASPTQTWITPDDINSNSTLPSSASGTFSMRENNITSSDK